MTSHLFHKKMSTSNVLTVNNTLLFTLADDIALLAPENDSISVTNTVQQGFPTGVPRNFTTIYKRLHKISVIG